MSAAWFKREVGVVFLELGSLSFEIGRYSRVGYASTRGSIARAEAVHVLLCELYGALVAVYLYSRTVITFGPSMTSVRDLTRVAASEDYRLAHGAAAR